MTTRKKVTPAPRNPADDDAAAEAAAAEDTNPFADAGELDENEKLDQFRDTYGGQQYWVRVEKLNDETNDLEIVDKIFLDTFDPFFLAKKYGGGRYRCTLLNEGGKYVKGGRLWFRFAKAIQPANAPAAAPAPADPMQHPVFALMIEQMRADKQMFAELLAKSLGAQKETDIDKLLAGLKTLQDLNPREREASPFKQFNEFLAFQKQLREASGGDDEKGSGLMGEITEALRLLMASRGVPPPARIPGAPAPRPKISGMPTISAPAAPAAAPATAAPSEVIVPASPAVSKLLFYLPKFEEAAAENADPDKWASMLCDILENEVVPALVKQYAGFVDAAAVWDRLIQAAGEPEKVETIFAAAPSLVPYREWVMKVIDAAVREMTPDPAPAAGANGAHGDEGAAG